MGLEPCYEICPPHKDKVIGVLILYAAQNNSAGKPSDKGEDWR